jgi:hypothetical protein
MRREDSIPSENAHRSTSYTGLTFPESRERIQTSLDTILHYFENLHSRKKIFCDLISERRFLTWTLLSLVILALYAISLSLQRFGEFQPGLLFTIVVYFVVYLFNFFCYLKYNYIAQVELSTLIKSIIYQYKSYLDHQLKSFDTSNEFPAIQVPSGHSQVSIVNVYRGHQWMKIPVLLLAEGDIIALMGGDITPCLVYELKVVNLAHQSNQGSVNSPSNIPAASTANTTAKSGGHHHNFGSTSTIGGAGATTAGKAGKTSEMDLRWVKTKLVPPGERIFIDVENEGDDTADIHHDETLNPDDFHLMEGSVQATNLMHEFRKVAEKHPHPASAPKGHLDNRHRVLGPESIEILRLTGNIRCFLIAETPIEPYIHSIYSKQVAIAERNRKTFIHQLRELVIMEGTRIIAVVLGLIMILAIIRFVLFEQNRIDWVYTFLIPFTNVILFITPVNVPFLRLVLQSIEIAEILTTLEVALAKIDSSGDNFKASVGGTTLHGGSPGNAHSNENQTHPGNNNPTGATNRDSETSLSGMNPPRRNSHQNLNNTGNGNGNVSGMKSPSAIHSPVHSPNHNNNHNHDNNHQGEGHHHNNGHNGHHDDQHIHHTHSNEFNDEFVDDDLDERVDENAEMTDTKVTYVRFFQYVMKVLKARLFIGQLEKPAREEDGNKKKGNFLPIPMASINITEQLGAITMVCFVDDDVISENYSVTEEIFLLTDDLDKSNNPSAWNSEKMENASPAAGAGGNIQVDKLHTSWKIDVNAAMNNPASHKSHHLPGGYTKGTVLDLHANPEATGSRFENPSWWKFLLSLKPLGLNALLTFKHTAENLLSSDDLTIPSSAYANSFTAATATGAGGATSTVSRKSLSASMTATANVPRSNSFLRPQSPLSPNPNFVSLHQHSSFPLPVMGATNTQQKLKSALHDIERALVRHIRKTMPLEFLRELAEEIGVGYDDLNIFSKAIEVNVIAPGLQNAHLLEDNHVWGQDETRRRGSLMPNLRGAVYRDTRGGGLQMMSLGDPSLILNYCKEYWDGNTRSITPLSSSDRSEVLNVYERWKLEDFDVVAFSYSPMPVPPLLYFLNNELFHTGAHHQAVAPINPDGSSLLSKKSMSTMLWNQSLQSNNQNELISKVPTVFFVDPSTHSDLIGGRVRKRSVVKSMVHQQQQQGQGTATAAATTITPGITQEHQQTTTGPLVEQPRIVISASSKDPLSRPESGLIPEYNQHEKQSSPLQNSDYLDERLTVSEKIVTNSRDSLKQMLDSKKIVEEEPEKGTKTTDDNVIVSNEKIASSSTKGRVSFIEEVGYDLASPSELTIENLHAKDMEDNAIAAAVAAAAIAAVSENIQSNSQQVQETIEYSISKSLNTFIVDFTPIDEKDTTISMGGSLMDESIHTNLNLSASKPLYSGKLGMRKSISDSNLQLKNALMKNYQSEMKRDDSEPDLMMHRSSNDEVIMMGSIGESHSVLTAPLSGYDSGKKFFTFDSNNDNNNYRNDSKDSGSINNQIGVSFDESFSPLPTVVPSSESLDEKRVIIRKSPTNISNNNQSRPGSAKHSLAAIQQPTSTTDTVHNVLHLSGKARNVSLSFDEAGLVSPPSPPTQLSAKKQLAANSFDYQQLANEDVLTPVDSAANDLSPSVPLIRSQTVGVQPFSRVETIESVDHIHELTYSESILADDLSFDGGAPLLAKSMSLNEALEGVKPNRRRLSSGENRLNPFRRPATIHGNAVTLSDGNFLQSNITNSNSEFDGGESLLSHDITMDDDHTYTLERTMTQEDEFDEPAEGEENLNESQPLIRSYTMPPSQPARRRSNTFSASPNPAETMNKSSKNNDSNNNNSNNNYNNSNMNQNRRGTKSEEGNDSHSLAEEDLSANQNQQSITEQGTSARGTTAVRRRSDSKKSTKEKNSASHESGNDGEDERSLKVSSGRSRSVTSAAMLSKKHNNNNDQDNNVNSAAPELVAHLPSSKNKPTNVNAAAVGTAAHHSRRSSLHSGLSTKGLARQSGGGASAHASRNNVLQKQRRRAALKELWTLMRQQIFLGMVASSVPVRRDVNNTKEDLDTAGIRFVYFSAQNMKRSKPVAEKIGIPFDWNCAISLRNLETSDKPDPHRHISNYADWDVLARMPHGIEAIRQHLKTVDNVPLLVSLFTDATPETIQSMIEIFRENGETVLSIGSGYRCYNQNIYSASNLATSVSVLPNVRSFLPAYERDLYDLFPVYSNHSMTKSDLKLSFDLVGLSTINLLQAKCFYSDIIVHRFDWHQRFDETLIDHLKLPVLLETIRKGRVLLLNELQYLSFYILTILSLVFWQVISYAIPLNIPPYCPPAMALVFLFVYLPLIILAMMFTDDHEGIMKMTPRKSVLQRKPKDAKRFYYYLMMRVSCILFSIWITGYLTTVSLFQQNNDILQR